MTALTFENLVEQLRPGGGACLTSITELEPAAGSHASVAPAKFAADSGTKGTYAYEQRLDGDKPSDAVIIDSKQSQLNRMEEAIVRAIDDGHPVLNRLPRVSVRYEGGESPLLLTDLQLPHRVFDAHIRAGSVADKPVTQLPEYRAARDSDQRDASALLALSPLSIVFGSWDSSRKQRQGRWRSLLTGEIIGFCDSRHTDNKGGARIDPLGQKIDPGKLALKALAERQKDELTDKTYKKLAAGDAKASVGGLGGIPPSLDALAGVACSRIVRSHVLSFAALRHVRFGKGVDGDVACRALLAALALAGLARADSDLLLRANCDLVEKSDPVVILFGRGGDRTVFDPITIDIADQILADAVAHAERTAGVRWDGVALEVVGDPAIVKSATDESENAG